MQGSQARADDVEVLRRLQGPDGAEVLAAIAAEGPDADPLRLATSLRKRFDADLVRAAQTQQTLRDAAAAKFSRAERMWFTRAGLEQATPEPVGRHRAARLGEWLAGAEREGARLLDLCCGIGGDLIAFVAAGLEGVHAVDIDPLHLAMAAANAAVYGSAGAVTTEQARVEEVARDGATVAFVDPARREGHARGGGRSSPPLSWVYGLAADLPVCVKARPGLDLSTVPAGWEREVVSLAGTLREACLWSPHLAIAQRRATVIDAEGGVHELVGTADETEPVVSDPRAYVLDPDPAVTRAGLVAPLAAKLGAAQIDPKIAFLTADVPFATPFGRAWTVEASLPWHERKVAAELRRLDIATVDVRRRGLAGDTDVIARRLAGAGERRATVLMTRARERPWALVVT